MDTSTTSNKQPVPKLILPDTHPTRIFSMCQSEMASGTASPRERQLYSLIAALAWRLNQVESRGRGR